jgi:diaminopimelate decarboxylase
MRSDAPGEPRTSGEVGYNYGEADREERIEMPQPGEPGSARDSSSALGGTDCLSVRDGRLFVEDCDATGLVERFGSPIFVTSEHQLRANVRRFRQAFDAAWPDGPVDVLPAFKANTTLATRHILSDEGAGADVYSPQELAGVLGTGVDPGRVSVNGGGKSREHLRHCVAAGVRITVEDVDEIDLVQEVAAEVGTTAHIRFRVKPTVPELWRRTDFSQLTVPIDLGVQVYKSGIPPEYLVDMGHRVFTMPNVELVGVHLHAGRHHPSLWFWRGLMTRYAQLLGELCRAWDGWRPAEIDVGGGMASPRDPHNKELPRGEFVTTALGYPFLVGLRALGDRLYHAALSRIVTALTAHSTPKAPPTIESYAATIAGTLRTQLHRQGVDTRGIRLQTEPGRALYGDAGVHLARVKVVKRQTRPIPYSWVLVDTTVFFLAGGVLEHNRHPVVVASRAAAPPTMKADVVGHSCYADQIVLGADLPEVAEGDVIALLETGAYQESSASNFNALPRPATVLVHGADAEIIKLAESRDDVYARDRVPERVRTTPARATDTGEETAR